MPTYVLMTKLNPPTGDDAKTTRQRGEDWKRAVEELCPGVKFIAHYALLGPYDFMDVYEAPDQATAFRISLLSRARGALTAESWPAIRYGELVAVMDELESR